MRASGQLRNAYGVPLADEGLERSAAVAATGYDAGLVASAIPLWETCAVSPPSMTISAPL